ncbi:MAG: AMP-binding protein, partial [Xanthomonadales bacterium]|nr:AMP-binding protein [Xanthomonadales bacterium]
DAGRMLALIEAEQVSHCMLVPAQVISLLDHPDFDPKRLRSLRMMLTLGAPMPAERREQWQRLLPGTYQELYGLTEGFVTILDADDATRKQGSVGCPPPLFDLRIVDEDSKDLPPGADGEILGRGPILMPGYYRRDELTAATIVDGWLHTGDIGHVDEEGFLYLVDRKKDMIDSGGVKVYPRDLEEIAARHPAVAEVAVFALPDPRLGEVPAAAVRLRPGQQAEAVALQDWINARVAAKYQRLRAVHLLADFPRNAAGKILKRELRERYAGR